MRSRLDSSAGINKAAANLSAGLLERTRLRCSSMSSRIVTAFPTHGIHRDCHNRLENGIPGELPKILGRLGASEHWKKGGVDGRTREARIKTGVAATHDGEQGMMPNWLRRIPTSSGASFSQLDYEPQSSLSTIHRSHAALCRRL